MWSRRQVLTTNAYLLGMVAVLVACTVKLGIPAMVGLYVIPYWLNVVWLDVVTYLHHHGSHDLEEKMPWYRGEVRQGVVDMPCGGRLCAHALQAAAAAPSSMSCGWGGRQAAAASPCDLWGGAASDVGQGGVYATREWSARAMLPGLPGGDLFSSWPGRMVF